MCLIGRDRSDDPPFRKTTVVYEQSPVRAASINYDNRRRSGHGSRYYDDSRASRTSYVSVNGSRKSSRTRDVYYSREPAYVTRDPTRVSYTARTSNPVVVERRSGPVAVYETRRIGY